MTDVVITELEEFEPDRVDGVKGAASGFPILLMKAASPDADADTSRPGPDGHTSGDDVDEGCDCCPNCKYNGHEAAAFAEPISLAFKEQGVQNPLEDNDATKGEVTETSAEETPQNEAFTKADVETIVKAAVTEATRAVEELVKALDARVAKVEETPIPGGPVMTVPATVRAERAKNEALAKAAHWDRLAEQSGEADMRREYRARAEAARANAGITST